MQLNITRIRLEDYGEYQCVAKNDINTTTANFFIDGMFRYSTHKIMSFSWIYIFFFTDKSKPPNRGSDVVAVFGALPPKRESFEDICGPPTTCPDCPDPREFKCKDTLVTLYDLVGHLEIKPTENVKYPGLPNRTFGMYLLYYKYLPTGDKKGVIMK